MLMRLTSLCLIVCVGTATAAEPQIPDGYKLVISEDFDTETSLGNFAFSDPNAWRWTKEGKSGGAMELYQQSKYETKYRSPFNIALWSKLRCGDLVMEVDMKQTGKEYGHRDMVLYFNFQSPTQFYYTHLATKPDPNAHNIFVVNQAPRKSFAPISANGIDWGSDWQHVRVERIGKEIRVFYQDMTKPVLSAQHDEFHEGLVGIGSFDDTGIIDNLRVWTNSSTTLDKPFSFKP